MNAGWCTHDHTHTHTYNSQFLELCIAKVEAGVCNSEKEGGLGPSQVEHAFGVLGSRTGSSVLSPFFFPFSFLFFFSFSFLMAAPVAYGRSQARGQIGAAAAGYAAATATWDPSHVCDLHHSSWQHQIPDPLSDHGQGSTLHSHGHCVDFLTC